MPVAAIRATIEAFRSPRRQRTAIVEIADCGRDDLARFFAELNFTRGVEVGTERGFYAETLIAANPDLRLYCVDPYLAYSDYREHTSQSKIDSFYDEARQRCGSQATFVRAKSTDAANAFQSRSLDFVYIDGNHTFRYVAEDLAVWVPKVRKGGIVAGHDYRRRKRNDRYKVHVVEVVNAFCQAYYIQPLFILGRKDVVKGEVRDEPRSWMFIKE